MVSHTSMLDTTDTFPALRRLRMIDAMHPGLVSCLLDTPFARSRG